MTITPLPSAAPSDREIAEDYPGFVELLTETIFRAKVNDSDAWSRSYALHKEQETPLWKSSREAAIRANKIIRTSWSLYFARFLSAARREARAAAIEECARLCEERLPGWNADTIACAEAALIASAIRALLPAPEPTQEQS